MNTREVFAAALVFSFAANANAEANHADAMQTARDKLHSSHGDGVLSSGMLERLEYTSNEGDTLAVWEGQGWIGGDLRKLWLKTEGEYAQEDNALEEFELQALYSRAVRPFWDVQFGVRQDIKPDPSRSYLVAALQGTAPYWFEVDGAVFLSDQGDVSVRLEMEYEFRLTQRWMLQPRLELYAAFTDDAAVGVGSGLSSAQAGLRLRYEISRQFAPYVGVSWHRAFGKTADFNEGHDDDATSVVAGVRMWF